MNQTLPNQELSAFAGQLSLILHSGISVLEGISILQEDLPSEAGRSLLGQVYETLLETGDLAESLRRTEVWPEYFVKMTELGERSGTLETVMASLSEYYDRQHALLRSIRDALTYPLILMGMLFAVLMVLMAGVMPVFYEVFEQLGIEVAGITSVVFRISSASQIFALALLIVLILALAFCIPALRSEQGKARLMYLIRLFPVTRRVLRQMAASRFSHALALALHSGLDMEESFRMAAELVNEKAFQEKAAAAAALIQDGQEFGDALKQTGIFAGLDARMISIGFRTGSAETVFEKLSVSCQEEADAQIQAAVGALEPTLTAVLSLLTGLILISVMLPLLNVMTNLG